MVSQRRLRVIALAGDDEDSTVHPYDVYVVPVQLAQHVAANHLFSRAARYATVRDVDDTVHDGQQRIHLVRGHKNRYLLFDDNRMQELDDFLRTARIKARQRLVEQEKFGFSHERVCD
jgi:hypothetical protein